MNGNSIEEHWEQDVAEDWWEQHLGNDELGEAQAADGIEYASQTGCSIVGVVICARSTRWSPAPLSGVALKLGRRPHVWFCGGRSSDAKRELHSFDHAILGYAPSQRLVDVAGRWNGCV